MTETTMFCFVLSQNDNSQYPKKFVYFALCIQWVEETTKGHVKSYVNFGNCNCNLFRL